MEISEIKSRLSIVAVLAYYNLQTDRNNRLCCPFHEDKTPSLQVYPETDTCYCFSSRCKTHGRSMDVIDFIMYMESCSKHEALRKCAALIGGNTGSRMQKNGEEGSRPSACLPVPPSTSKAAFLGMMFDRFRNALYHSKPGIGYLEGRYLDYRNMEVGFNGGQFHHGTRKEERFIAQCLAYGLLLDRGLTCRTGEKAYSVFGKNCVVFPLKNRNNEIVSLYFRSIVNDKEQRHFYLKGREGLYPSYPQSATKRLILTESIIDAATLSMTDYALQNTDCSVLALYGTNGLTDEHRAAISVLDRLEEIVFFLNGDEAGKRSTAKYGKELKESYPKLQICSVDVPASEDVNSLLQGHEASLLVHLIATRKPIENGGWATLTDQSLKVENAFSFSSENATEKANAICQHKIPAARPSTSDAGLDTSCPSNLRYRGKAASYRIRGFRSEQCDSLKITLQIITP